MAKTLDDIQESFENIVQMLGRVTNQTLANSDETNNALKNINTKIELLANEDNSDLIKVFLAELKKGVEDKHNFVSLKFNQIENAFKALQERAGEKLNASEIRELFDIIATNLSVFSKEVIVQKDLLGDIVLQIDAFRQDDSQKKEIVKNISYLKNDLDKFNNGFESLILNISESFKNIAEQIDETDGTEALAGLKKDIENIFLSSNAVLSTLQVIDHKNRELEQVLVSLVTKKEYEFTNSKVEELINKNTQLTERILTLSSKADLENLANNVDTAIGVIGALKEVLIKTGDKNHELLIGELANLETTVSQILSQEDFLKFKDELSNLISEVVQISNITRSDLLDTNFELKNLALILGALDIKGNFQQLAGVVEGSRENVNSTIYDLSNRISALSEKNTANIKEDLAFSTKGISEQILSIEHNLKNSAKDNLGSILGDIKEVLDSISSIKSEVHFDNMQNLNVISERLQLIKEDVLTSKDFTSQESKENVEAITSKIQDVSAQLEFAKSNLNQRAQTNFENISKEIDTISNQISVARENIIDISNANLQEFLMSLQGVVQKIEHSRQDTKTDLIEQVITLKDSVYSLPLIIKENQSIFENEKKALIEENSKSIEDLTQKILSLTQGILAKDNPLKDIIGFEAANLKELINNSKDELSKSNSNIYDELKANLSAIESIISDNSRVYDKTLGDLKDDLEIYLNKIRNNTQDSDAKIETSIKEILELKAEIQAISESFVNVSSNSDEKFGEVAHSINSAFSGILTNITQIEAGLTSRNQENLQKTIFVMDEKFDKILEIVEDYKTQVQNQNAENKDFIFNAEEKITSLKQEIGLINTDVINAINTKVQNVLIGLEPIKEGVDQLLEFDFNRIVIDIKSQIDLSHLLLNTSLKDAGSENKAELIDKISDSFGEFEIKLNSAKAQIMTGGSNNAEAIRSDLAELNSKLESILAVVAQEPEDKTVEILEQLSKLETTIRNSDLTEKIDSKFSALNQSLKENSEQLDALIAENLSSSMTELSEQIQTTRATLGEASHSNFEHLSEKLTNLSDEIQTTRSGLGETSHSNFEHLSEKLTELSEEIQMTHTDLGKNSHSNFEHLSEKLETLTKKMEVIQINLLQEDKKIPDYSEVFEDVKSALEEIAQATIYQKNQLSQEIGMTSDSVNQGLDSVMNALELQLTQGFQGGINQSEILKEEMASLISQMHELKDTFASAHSDEFKQLSDKSDGLQSQLARMEDVILEDLDRKISSIKFEPQNTDNSAIEAQLALIEEKIETLDFAVDLEGPKSQIIGEIESLKLQYDYVSEKATSDLLIRFEDIEQRIDISEQTYKNSANTLLSEVKKSFYNQVEQNLEELKLHLEANGQQKDYSVDISELKSELLGKFNQVESSFADAVSNLKPQDIGLDEKLATLETNLNQSIQELKSDESLKDEIAEKLVSLETKLNESIQELKSDESLKDEIAEKLVSLETKLNESIQELKSDENLKDEIGEKLASLETKLNESIQELKSDESLKDEIGEKLASLETNLNRSIQILKPDSSLNEEIDVKFTALENTLETSLSALRSNDELEALYGNILDTVRNLLNNFHDNLSLKIGEDNQNEKMIAQNEQILDKVEAIKNGVIEDVFIKFEEFSIDIGRQKEDFQSLKGEISTLLEDLKTSYSEFGANSNMAISKYFEEFDEKIELLKVEIQGLNFAEQFKSEKNLIVDEITSLKDSYIELGINTSMEISNTLSDVDERITAMEIKIDNLNLEDKIVSEFDKINEKIEDFAIEIKNDVDLDDEFNELRALLNAQSETIRLQTDSVNTQSEIISAQIDSINAQSESINAQSELIKDFSAHEVFNKLEELDRLEELKKLDTLSKAIQIDELEAEIKEIFAKIDLKLNANALEEKEELKSELSSMKEDILENLNSNLSALLEKRSAGDETEELKGLIAAQNTDIKGLIEDKTIDIKDLVDDKTGNIATQINAVKKQLQLMQNGTEGEIIEYMYTMQDLESDIAKVRLELKQLSKPEKDAQLEELVNKFEHLKASLTHSHPVDLRSELNRIKDEMLSVSQRTNQLLLSADDTNLIVKDNMDDFKAVITDVAVKLNQLGNIDAISEINKKIDNLNKLVVTNVQSTKTLNQAFMYLGEWIDSTSVQLKNIENKFDEQQGKIELIEDKVDEILSAQAPLSKNDMREILEEILADKSDEKLTKKVENLERQLLKLNKNVDKLASYVDEE